MLKNGQSNISQLKWLRRLNQKVNSQIKSVPQLRPLAVYTEKAAEIIHLAIAAEKVGRKIGDLWPFLFAECGFDVDQVNSVVCLYSNGLVNEPLRLDL